MLDKIYLAQTDTTAGFLSKSKEALNKLKNRALNQPCIITSAKFSELKTLTRVPKNFKNFVRKAKKTTFVYKNDLSIRIVKNCAHAKFLQENGYFYSSSANLHGENFNEKWAKSAADIILDEKLSQNQASKIIKLNRKKARKLR